MELAESERCHVYIESVRDDIAACEQQLRDKRLQIAEALKQSEDLTIDAATLKVRMKELELDEEVLKQAEEAAIKDKVLAEKRLMEVGGYERAARVLQKTLLDAKQELQNTKGAGAALGEAMAMTQWFTTHHQPADEKAHIMSEEKKLHHELVQLNMILHKSRAASAKLQQECAAAMKSKEETDEKLERLTMFLQKTVESVAGLQSPSPSRSALKTLALPPTPPPSPTKMTHREKESAAQAPSPLPSPSSIRSKLSRWASASPTSTTTSTSTTTGSSSFASSASSSAESSPTGAAGS